MPNAILQLKVFLSGERHYPDPGIFRTLQVPDNLNFYQLHCILQLSFGWSNSHCHEFRDIFNPDTVFTNMTQYWEQDMAHPIDSRKVKIKEYLQENAIMFYVYDMGDNWVHVIFVEQIIVPAPHIPYPVCIGGAKKCPPEDCGGLSGYYEMIAVLKKGKGEFYQEYLQWLGSSYERDPF